MPQQPIAQPGPTLATRAVPAAQHAAPLTTAPARAVESAKIPLFGARKHARALTEQRDALAQQLDALGGMELADVRQLVSTARAELEQIRSATERARREQTETQSQLLNVRAAFNLQEVALYDYEHPAESSAKLADELSVVRQKIKDAIRDKKAATATQNFTFNDSAAKGRHFVDQMTRTMLAAYNAEVENCVKAVRAGNLSTARARLDRMVERVAKNGEMINLRITPEFHRLRLRELELAARHLESVKREKEEERERRAEQREQERAERELQAERARLEKERQHYLNALEALRLRGDAQGVADLKAKIADVDRAITDVDYRTANIRAGYVYIISNVGSFGPTVVKIGMTRRLDPMDRVRELGDASVPFRYDVHALFFADDAVSIETMLHREFAEQRINKVNSHREFFRVTPQQVLAVLESHNVKLVEYRVDPEAEEFRLSGGAV